MTLYFFTIRPPHPLFDVAVDSVLDDCRVALYAINAESVQTWRRCFAKSDVITGHSMKLFQKLEADMAANVTLQELIATEKNYSTIQMTTFLLGSSFPRKMLQALHVDLGTQTHAASPQRRHYQACFVPERRRRSGQIDQAGRERYEPRTTS